MQKLKKIDTNKMLCDNLVLRGQEVFAMKLLQNALSIRTCPSQCVPKMLTGQQKPSHIIVSALIQIFPVHHSLE